LAVSDPTTAHHYCATSLDATAHMCRYGRGSWCRGLASRLATTERGGFTGPQKRNDDCRVDSRPRNGWSTSRLAQPQRRVRYCWSSLHLWCSGRPRSGTRWRTFGIRSGLNPAPSDHPLVPRCGGQPCACQQTGATCSGLASTPQIPAHDDDPDVEQTRHANERDIRLGLQGKQPCMNERTGSTANGDAPTTSPDRQWRREQRREVERSSPAPTG
jgi:hypothetical protein